MFFILPDALKSPLLFAPLLQHCSAVLGSRCQQWDERHGVDFDFVLLEILLEYDCVNSERSCAKEVEKTQRWHSAALCYVNRFSSFTVKPCFIER
jgi:hypothetical protein